MTTRIHRLLTALLTVLFIASFLSAAAPIEGELTVPYTSAYTFRGAKLAGQSLQPSVSLSLGNLTATVWANQPLAREVDPEIDGTISLTSDIAVADMEVGLTAYRYPGGSATTWEPYIGISRDLKVAKVGVTAYYDWKLKTHTYEASVSREIAVGKRLTLTPKATGGVVGSYSYWQGGLEGSFAVAKHASLFGGGAFTSSNDRKAERDIASYSVGVRVGF